MGGEGRSARYKSYIAKLLLINSLIPSSYSYVKLFTTIEPFFLYCLQSEFYPIILLIFSQSSLLKHAQGLGQQQQLARLLSCQYQQQCLKKRLPMRGSNLIFPYCGLSMQRAKRAQTIRSQLRLLVIRPMPLVAATVWVQHMRTVWTFPP